MTTKLSFYLFIIIFFLQFTSFISILSFTYPNALTLKNGNIFVIHKNGVSICDYSFSTILREIIVFSEELQISDTDHLSKVLLEKFNDGYIVSIIINKIFIFDINGNLKYESNEPLSNEPDLYFSLSIDEIVDNEKHYYLVGYIFQGSIYLKHYRYWISTNKNELYGNANGIKDNSYISYSNNYSILNKGLSCQVLSKQSSDLYVCMYFVYYPSQNYLSLLYLTFDKNRATINSKTDKNYYPWNDIKYIKSIHNKSRSKAFFCLLLTTGEINCFLYDIRDTSTINDYKRDSVNCITDYY